MCVVYQTLDIYLRRVSAWLQNKALVSLVGAAVKFILKNRLATTRLECVQGNHISFGKTWIMILFLLTEPIFWLPQCREWPNNPCWNHGFLRLFTNTYIVDITTCRSFMLYYVPSFCNTCILTLCLSCTYMSHGIDGHWCHRPFRDPVWHVPSSKQKIVWLNVLSISYIAVILDLKGDKLLVNTL